MKIEVEDYLAQAEVLDIQDGEQEDLLFFDRGLQDTLAYNRAYDFPITESMLTKCSESKYSHVFLMSPLDTYTTDYARTEPPEFVATLHTLLKEAYQEYGYKVIEVPVLEPLERAKFILQHID